MMTDEGPQHEGPVLLVCVYNRFGKIITHEYLYEMFEPFGEIVKILIFEKAKVWKTFVEYRSPASTVEAMAHLNNKVIFEDGSKMNIFHSKLRHVQFQNDNLGGVNYESLKRSQKAPSNTQNSVSDLAQSFEVTGIRKRNSTFQDYYEPSHHKNTQSMKRQSFGIGFEGSPTNIYDIDQNLEKLQIEEEREYQKNSIPSEQQELFANESNSSSFQKSENHDYKKHPNLIVSMEMSDSTFHKSGSLSGGRAYQHSNNAKRSLGSFNNFGDVDDLFREIALQSDEFRLWEQNELEGSEVVTNRKKAKTIVNPHSEQFMLENCPSRVIFIRSIPDNLNHHCIYNIFANFGSIMRMIFMKDKMSALVEFEDVSEAIRAKDEINYVKSEMKIFYSHYESLVLRRDCENELSIDYSGKSSSSQRSHSLQSSPNKKRAFNPPSETLYATMLNPSLEGELTRRCLDIGCKVKQLEWKENTKDKWMCLIQFNNINDSLCAMALLQNEQMSNGRKIKLAFTRSKIDTALKQSEFRADQHSKYTHKGRRESDKGFIPQKLKNQNKKGSYFLRQEPNLNKKFIEKPNQNV